MNTDLLQEQLTQLQHLLEELGKPLTKERVTHVVAYVGCMHYEVRKHLAIAKARRAQHPSTEPELPCQLCGRV